MQAYSVPCWLVGWWLWRAGCFSQDTYLLYTIIPLYGYLDEESVDHDKRGEHGIVQLLQLVEGHLKKGRFLI